MCRDGTKVDARLHDCLKRAKLSSRKYRNHDKTRPKLGRDLRSTCSKYVSLAKFGDAVVSLVTKFVSLVSIKGKYGHTRIIVGLKSN
jgi:hypothetical protein